MKNQWRQKWVVWKINETPAWLSTEEREGPWGARGRQNGGTLLSAFSDLSNSYLQLPRICPLLGKSWALECCGTACTISAHVRRAECNPNSTVKARGSAQNKAIDPIQFVAFVGKRSGTKELIHLWICLFLSSNSGSSISPGLSQPHTAHSTCKTQIWSSDRKFQSLWSPNPRHLPSFLEGKGIITCVSKI